jgi:hypothetical protein
MVVFELLEEPVEVETFDSGRGIRELERLRRRYGGRRWRRCKGYALVALQGGEVCRAELHWYECHGVGRRQIKIKRLLD